MTSTPISGFWRLAPKLFTTRPKLALSLAVGIAVGGACALFIPGLRSSSAIIAGWDAFCALHLALVFQTILNTGPDHIRARAAKEDQGNAVILALILAACVASLAAVGVELSIAREEHGLARSLYVAAAFVTVTASWFLMQVVFALHYAHAYYTADPATGADHQGLAFPGETSPDYWDFLHFSIVIGVAAQTADIAFTDRQLRQLGTLHSLIAFAFNTLIVALTINLLAGLF